MVRSKLLIALLIALGHNLHAQRVLPVGTGISGAGSVYDMLEYNGQLVFGGVFSGFNGHTRYSLQGWDGVNHYDFPGAFEMLTYRVTALEVFNGDLIAAGHEPNFGHIARWNGNGWQSMGAGLSSWVKTLCIFNGELYAAGDGATVSRWDGSNWTQLGSAFNGSIEILEVHNGELYVGGAFDHDAGGTTELRHLVKWNGSIWIEVNNGFNDTVLDMLSTPEGLVIVGQFITRGDNVQSFPFWTIYDGSLFSEPTPSIRYQVRIVAVSNHPDGGFILSGIGPYSVWVNDNVSTDIRFRSLRAVVDFNGTTYLGGITGESYLIVKGLGRLVEGTDIAWLDGGGNSATITPVTGLFYNAWENHSGLEAPKGDSTYTLTSTSPWMIGNNMGTMHSSTPTYNLSEELTTGPNSDTMDIDYFERYFQVWKLDRDIISHHSLHWNDLGYTTPYVISSWPGNGDVTNGEPTQIAPFADLNGNGVYEPHAGEFPLIRGDQAIYSIQHSVLDYNGNPKMKLDIGLMSYAFKDPFATDLYATIFSNMTVVNRGPENYTDARFGIFADMDIGYEFDDLLGCDSTLNLFYGYNSDNVDEGTDFSSSYGTDLPAQGVVFLNHPMTSHRTYLHDNTDIIDMISGTYNGSPFTNLGYPTNFQYPGGAWPDPGTSIFEPISVGAIGPFTYNSGDTICVDVAYPYAMSASGNRLESVTDLKARAQALRAWYATQDLACGSYPDNITTVSNLDASSFALYPNPSSGEVTLTGYPAKETLAITVRNVLGALVQKETWPAAKQQFTLSTDGWNDGIYLLSIAGKDRTTALRLVVAH